MKMLVIRGGALGDFVLTLPVLAALRGRFPGQRLEILGHPSYGSLATAAGLADAVSPLESPEFAGFFVSNGKWPSAIATWLSGFKVIVSYLYDSEGTFAANIAHCSAASFIVGTHRPDETLGVHAAELLLRPLESLGIARADLRPRLSLPGAPIASRRLAIHPGSGSEKKNWPEAKWMELLRILAAQSSCDFLLIGGEAEGERCARLATALPRGRVQIAQNLPLIELARLMKSCAAFVGHDSGITHLAAALDVPGIVLWGESDLITWRPQSDRMKILRDPAGLKELPVKEVLRELKSYL